MGKTYDGDNSKQPDAHGEAHRWLLLFFLFLLMVFSSNGCPIRHCACSIAIGHRGVVSVSDRTVRIILFKVLGRGLGPSSEDCPSHIPKLRMKGWVVPRRPEVVLMLVVVQGCVGPELENEIGSVD